MSRWAAVKRSRETLPGRFGGTQLIQSEADVGVMTAPRRIIPGSSYVVSRRCTQRRFYFTPSPALVRDFKYVIACAAQAFDIEIHALVFMSNHYHIWLTDPAGTLPRFMHTLNRNLAHVVKAHHPDIEGEVFDGQPYNASERSRGGFERRN